MVETTSGYKLAICVDFASSGYSSTAVNILHN